MLYFLDVVQVFFCVFKVRINCSEQFFCLFKFFAVIEFHGLVVGRIVCFVDAVIMIFRIFICMVVKGNAYGRLQGTKDFF